MASERAVGNWGGHGISALSFFLFLGLASSPSQSRLVDGILNYKGNTETFAALPKLLSGSGLYANIAVKARTVTEGISPYEINAALWSDGTHKTRWITIPAGTKIVPTDSDKYDFPDKTVLIKNFAYDTLVGDTASRILVETRFLVYYKTANGFETKGISYAWKRDQTDADLVDPIFGLFRTIPVKAGGKQINRRWTYPSRGQCTQCHTGRGVLGFITPQLDRQNAVGAPNQLADFAAKGLLTRNPATAFRYYGVEAATGTLEQKSRSWLAANCSHCHGNANFAVVGVLHDFDYMKASKPYLWTETGAEGGYMGKPSTYDEGYPKFMYPGRPDSSFAIKRMVTRGSPEEPLNNVNDQMPPLASYVPDSAAVRVVADWICQVGGKPTGAACKIPDVEQPAPAALKRDANRHSRLMNGQTGLIAYIAGGYIHMQAPLRRGSAGSGAPVLTDAKGSAVSLAPAGKDVYALPGGLPPGTYFLHWQGETIPVSAGI